jgi:PAS domain S-box-containing protein
MAQRLGLADPREAVGKTGFELPGHEAALAVHQQDEVVLRTGEAQDYKLEKRERIDGAVEWDLVSRLPLTDNASRIVGIIGIFRSVTDQKQAEEKIRDAVRRRDEFLAMLSHELRNPLGAIVFADTREMLCTILSDAGFECESSDNGSAGLALIDAFKPHAAIIDIGLPALDGLEVARRVRKDHAHVYLVALTGYGQRADRALALDAGFDEHLVKPVAPATLRRLLGAGTSALG